MEMNKTKEIDMARAAWKLAIDPSVIKAATENWEEYAPYVQVIIEAEAKGRGLWEKVLYLRGGALKEPISQDDNRKGYICNGCKGDDVNFATGRCRICNLPPNDISYCKTCDNFFSISPGELCPEDGTKLVRYKAAMDMSRVGNFIFDKLIIDVALGFLGLAALEFFGETGPITEWILFIIFFFLYYIIFESIWQRTPGKFITGTKVVTCDGTKPTIGTIAKRALIRFVPFDPLSFLNGRAYGWHDRWSKTYVIKAQRFEKKNRP
jgi:uncharacterized RDD family membrane protein YckC